MDLTDYKVLNNLYNGSVINEGTKQEDIEDLEKLYNNPDEAFAKKNYGSVQAYKDMLKKKIEKLKESKQRPNDEESAENIIGDGPDTENVDKIETKKKSVKKESKNINNLKKDKVMTQDKSIFDKLFEQVMGEADDEAMELGIDLDGTGDEDGGEFGGGDDITITLTPDHVQLLKDILAQVEPEEGEEEEGEESEEMDMGYEEESAEPFEEENQHTNDGAKPGVDPSDGGGKTSEPAGDSLGGKSSGTGDAAVTDEVGTKHTGDGKKTGHDPSGLSGTAKYVVKQ